MTRMTFRFTGLRFRAALAAVSLAILAGHYPCLAQGPERLVLQTASGGITFGGTSPNFTSGFGNVNGLGLGTPPAGLTLYTTGVTGGVLYTTPVNLVISGVGPVTGESVKAYVSTNFAHPSALSLELCYPSSACNSAASYTTISTNAGSPSWLISTGITTNQTVIGSLGLFVSNTSGAGGFNGSDSATVTFLVYNSNNNNLAQTIYLTLNNPNENVQTAVQLSLATASGGLTISPASDFSTDFGSIDGLGLTRPAGLSVTSQSGEVIYNTPYYLQPVFSNFTSSSGTLKAYVSTNFAHSSILELEDGAASGGPYTVISTSSGSPTTMTTSAASGSSVTRYLGLLVSNANGAGAFTGSDNATLTYTLSVP